MMVRSHPPTFFFVLFIVGIFISGPAYGQVYENSFDGQSGMAGEANGWSVDSGEWEIHINLMELHGRPESRSRGEGWAWVGSPAIELPEAFSLHVGVEFLEQPEGDVGRHGGIMFCATTPTNRRDPRISGYQLYWIDRRGDRGLHLFRTDNGVSTWIAGRFCGEDGEAGEPGICDPPLEWRIVVGLTTIYVFGDDELLIAVNDETYRDGHLGLFVWFGNLIAYDDFLINEGGLSGCEVCEPEAIEIGRVYDHQLDCLVANLDVPTKIYALEVDDFFEGSISVSSDDFDPSLSFYNDFCDEVARNNVCRIAEADACLNVNLGPGIYTIGVRSQDPEVAGNFSISVSGAEDVATFTRGDANADGAADISDGVFVLNYLFLGGRPPFCPDSADVNDDGAVGLSDAVYLLDLLFRGGSEVAPPGLLDCGIDPTEDDLDCERFPPCEL